MRREQITVTISTTDVTPALGLLDEKSGVLGQPLITTLDITAEEPSGGRKLFRPGKLGGISVLVREPIEPGGAHLWSTDVEFPRKTDLTAALAQAGVEWVPWWAIPEEGITHLIPKIRCLSFSGFCWPQVALPWFIRVHAAFSGVDPSAPVQLTRTHVDRLDQGVDADLGLVMGVLDSIRRDEYDRNYIEVAYEEWKPREAEWRRQAFPNG